MTTLVIAGRQLDVPPLKLGALRRAAPHIDAINAIANALSTLEGATQAARSFLEVIAISAEKADATITADALEELADLSDFPRIQQAFTALLAESGLTSQGEATASLPKAKARGSKGK